MLNKPDVPAIGRITHYSIYIEWTHLKNELPVKNRKKFRYKLEELALHAKEWRVVYVGFGVCTTVTGLDPLKEYSYRIKIAGPNDQLSEYSDLLKVTTRKEPVNCELFHKAIFFDKRSEIEKFLKNDDDDERGYKEKLLEIPDRLGNTALMIAVMRDNVELVEILIENGAFVDFQNESLKTALMLAAFHGRLQHVKILRQYNALYTKRDNSGMCPIHYAIDGGHCDTLEYMITDGANVNELETTNGWTPLIRAASMNCGASVASVLIKYGALVNVTDYQNKTALTLATVNGNLPLVKELVRNGGADLELKNSEGNTIYDLAVSMDRQNIFRFLDEYAEEKNISLRKRLTSSGAIDDLASLQNNLTDFQSSKQ